MDFSAEEIQEFKNEAEELLQEAEDSLLNVERGQEFKSNYNLIFRSFHSLKGAAGMLELHDLQSHMHKIENLFQGLQNCDTVPAAVVTYFLKSIDAARDLLNFKSVEFSYDLPTENDVKTEPDPLAPKVAQATETKNEDVIYIIDDEEDIVEILGRIMTKYSLPWKGFSSPTMAMEEFSKDRPVMVISDMKMPGMSGIEVLKRVKEQNSDIPVIFISGHLSKELLLKALSLGVFGVVEKPFKETPVISVVTNALKEKKMWELLNKTIDMILFKVDDLEKFLKSQGRNEIASMLKDDVETLLISRRELKKSLKLPE